ncbi:translation initiation factor 3 subunit F [Metschnikowia aff. pulcherrima]|uniref:Translation initiation factor 3 subunit F n=1 Tax=Metschnikowia aff. pulcherrima TaxID=2163413 RepID=A0A4P6XV63_9ASCO|nr:translation initiation factor 3 subunit F [Metschnikowia aff. pulcherrima]
MANTYMHLVRPTVAAPAAPAAASPADVLIHNLALFLILEIVSKQILEQNTRIIGTLLGVRSDDGSKVEIRDAFMVPCQETGDSISIEEHKHKALYSLYKKAHPKESVLGWFDCAGQIDASTGLIHDFYLKGADRAYPFPAIYLNVKYLNGDSIEFPTLTTYIGAALGKPGRVQKIGWKTVTTNTLYIFSPIPHTVGASTISEKLALGTILQTLTLKENSVQLHAEQLLTVSREIKTVQAHIDAVLAAIGSASHTDADIDMLRSLSNSLLNRPTILSDLDALKHHFQAHNQDIIMIEYLTRAVKEQIELSVRLSAEAEKKLA